MIYLVLASASEDRKRCFERILFPVIIIPSNFDESSVPINSPPQYVQQLAFQKANHVRNLWISNYLSKYGDAVIIGADTMVVMGEELIGKAQSVEEAHQILNHLSGRTHELFTGVCLLSTKSLDNLEKISFYSRAKVHMQKLTHHEINLYLSESGEFQGRAGAYSLYDRASLFIDFIEGSPTNVLGLPMAVLRKKLLSFGIDLLKPSGF